MTREEAKRRMEICRDFLANNYSDMGEPNFTAFNMAIQALSQEPCQLLIIKSDILLHQDDKKKWMDSIKREKENGVIILPPYFTPLLVPDDVEIRIEQPCDNAIDREYLFKVLDDFCGHDRTETITLDTLADLVYDMPSVTQKSGKWTMSDDGLYRPICDKCGAHPWKGYIPTVEEATEVFKYCPNCGAKMESEG